MSLAAPAMRDDILLPDLLPLCAEALTAAESFGAAARRAVAQSVAPGGKVDAGLLERRTATPGWRPTSRRCARCCTGPSAWRRRGSSASWNN